MYLVRTLLNGCVYTTTPRQLLSPSALQGLLTACPALGPPAHVIIGSVGRRWGLVWPCRYPICTSYNIIPQHLDWWFGGKNGGRSELMVQYFFKTKKHWPFSGLQQHSTATGLMIRWQKLAKIGKTQGPIMVLFQQKNSDHFFSWKSRCCVSQFADLDSWFAGMGSAHWLMHLSKLSR